jgi:hypothetical protein
VLHPLSSNGQPFAPGGAISVGLRGSREAPGRESAEQSDRDGKEQQAPMVVNQLHRYPYYERFAQASHDASGGAAIASGRPRPSLQESGSWPPSTG